MLSTPWEQRKSVYDFVVIGSGYGGSITAARLAAANLTPKPSVCILERGREWPVGSFPEDLTGVLGAQRRPGNALGLYELISYRDISVIKGSGLGGTSLINANVAIVPDREVYEMAAWPASVTFDGMQPYYQRAAQVLGANPHPRAAQLRKVQALDRRAQELGRRAQPLNIVVNFDRNGANAHGVEQKPCTDCGNCVTGCNVGAKNTLAMNYLPLARNAGAQMFTQTKVEWLEKRADGWRIHGRRYRNGDDSDAFTLDAREVVLAAGSLNSTEILLRSEMHGLRVSPALGTRFGGNADFFGLAYNGDFETDVLGYRAAQAPGTGDSPAPGPNIVAVLRYNGSLPESQRITVEDFSFPRAYLEGAKALFGVLRGEDTVLGNEDAQRERLLRDLNPLARPHDPNGAMNHSMLYLVMGLDNARGTIQFEAPFTEPDGRIRVSWDQAGQQQIFRRMNEELRRHARALRGNFISNPTWSVFNLGHLITAHPLGGCPMGDDYLEGAVDSFGRVFSGDGAVHPGLYVADGAVLPTALGVNPFLSISALTERFVERRIQALQGDAYPAPPRAVSMAGLDALDVIGRSEAELETLFRRSTTLPIQKLVNRGGVPHLNLAQRTVRNDRYWKGFFPKGHVLNAMSSAIFTGFKKEFKAENGRFTGLTSDTDGRIRARNTLEEITLDESRGTLEAGKYILLRYADPPWQGYYDILKVINEDLIIGRVYLGEFPHGLRMFTFAMSRLYGFDRLTVDDHRALYDTGAVPTAADLAGVWRMDTISNANSAGGIAYLQFDQKPDGRLEARYHLMGLLEGLVVPTFLQDHFRLNDFTTFHDEIRRTDRDLLVGKYVTELPAVLAPVSGGSSLGLFHGEAGGKFGFYYTLTRVAGNQLPVNTILRPFLDAQLPDGVGLTFDEEMVGWYFPGAAAPGAGREADLAIGARVPPAGEPAGAVKCSFKVRMTVRDLNEFIDGYEHEAAISGSISFAQLEGGGPVSFSVDPEGSRFNYLRVNPATGEAEMRYRIAFRSNEGRRFRLEGRKYLQKDRNGVVRSIQDLLEDYTTLYGRLYEHLADGSVREAGVALLRFRTFEDLAAVGNLAGFLNSFQVTGTANPQIQLQARFRFMAFTAQFVLREYDPLAPPVRASSAGGRG